MSIGDGGARPAAWCAALIPVAGFVALDPAGWYPFGPAKWFAVSVVAATAVAAGLGDGLAVPRRAAALWSVLLGLIFVAAIVGLDPRIAWLGTAERNLGAIAWLLFLGCFAVGASLPPRAGGREADVGAVAAGFVAATAAATAYALWELLFGRPVALAVTTDRLGGTFGSAAYLGAAMCLGLPVAAGVAADDRLAPRWRIAAGTTALAAIVALLGSGARAAWLGIGVATVVLLARVARTSRRGARPVARSSTPDRKSATAWRRTVIAVVAVSAIALVVVGPRLDDVLDRDTSVTARFDEWEVAARTIAEHPLLGSGPEGYRLVVGEGIDGDYELAYGREVAPDRAHNAPLDVAAIAGIPAGLVYLGLLALVVVAGGRAAMSARPMIAGMGAAVVAYAVQQLALFPVAELDAAFWLLAGVVVTMSGAALRPVRGRVRGEPVAQVLCAVLAVALFAVGLLGVAADRLAARAASAPDAVSALEAGERAVELRPDVLRTRLLLAALEASDGTLAGIDRAIDTTDAALDWSARDPIVRRRRAAYLSRRAEATGDQGDMAGALAAWGDLLVDDPNCAPCLIGLGAASALAGDVVGARRAWTRAGGLTSDPLPADLLARLDDLDGRGAG